MKLYNIIIAGSAVYNVPMSQANILESIFGSFSSARPRREANRAVATSCDIADLHSSYPIQDGQWVCKGNACSVYCYDPSDPTVKTKSMNKMAKCQQVEGVYQWTSFSPQKPELYEVSCSTKHKKSKYVPPTTTAPPTTTTEEVVTVAPEPEEPVPDTPDDPVTNAPVTEPPTNAPVTTIGDSDLVDPSKPWYTKPKYNPVRDAWNYDKDGKLMCELAMLRDVDNGTWRCKGRGAKQYCSLNCDNPDEQIEEVILHPKLVTCTEGEWVPTSQKVVQIDHMTCDGRSNKVPKKAQNDGEALCNYVDKPTPADDGSWVCDKKGSKCFLRCYNEYENVKTRKTIMKCIVNGNSKEWKITKGKNACYNTKNCATQAIPDEANYAPGVFTCNAGKSCNFQCGDIHVQTARKCSKGGWVNTTGEKKGRESDPADVACCTNAVKPAAPTYGDFMTSCKKNKFGGEVCLLTCSNGAVLNKRLKARVTCVGNQWELTGHTSCDQVEINEFVKEHRKNNMSRGEFGEYYEDYYGDYYDPNSYY